LHEGSIVESLIELVAQSVPEQSRVRRVEVRVGLLSGVSPDSLQFYFEILREGSICDGAELAVLLEPLQAYCEACGQDHSLGEAAWLCPCCGAGSLAFRNGDELHLSSIEVEDGESIHD
jgi:hydrogenase nickel incorporation protein HypA/HybF